MIDVTKMPNNGRVIFGATVTVLNLDTDEEQTYRIVGDDEADFKQNLISVNSPIARGLIGKEQDDVVVIKRLAAMWNTKCLKWNTFKQYSIRKLLVYCKERKKAA